MNAIAAEQSDDMDAKTRERRCIVTGEILPDRARLRFVVDPDGRVVPDIEETLPGRGMWVKAERAAVEHAIAKNLFSRAAKHAVIAASDLPERTETQLVRRMQGDLGLARKSAALVFGFDNVARALADKVPPALLVEASDGSPEGQRKLRNILISRATRIGFVNCLTRAELALALGRENVIHAAVKPGRLAERLILEAARLEGFRPAGRQSIEPAAPVKGHE